MGSVVRSASDDSVRIAYSVCRGGLAYLGSLGAGISVSSLLFQTPLKPAGNIIMVGYVALATILLIAQACAPQFTMGRTEGRLAMGARSFGATVGVVGSSGILLSLVGLQEPWGDRATVVAAVGAFFLAAVEGIQMLRAGGRGCDKIIDEISEAHGVTSGGSSGDFTQV